MVSEQVVGIFCGAFPVGGRRKLIHDPLRGPCLHIEKQHGVARVAVTTNDVAGVEWRRDVKPHQLKSESGVFALAFHVDAAQLAVHNFAFCVEHEPVGGIVVFVRIDRAARYFYRGRILLLKLIPDCLETFFVAGVGAIIAPALMGTSRLVLKEIHVLARLFEPGDFLALPSDDVAKKDMEVGDIERAVSPVHRTIGHVVDDLLPALDLLP